MSRPRLLILAFSRLVSDARVLRQVRLFAQGYAVTTVGYGEAPEGVVEHVRIPDETADCCSRGATRRHTTRLR
jgi:hypothetical protein